LLNSNDNTLCYVRGIHPNMNKVLYPPIENEVSKEVCKEVNEMYTANERQGSLIPIMEKYKLDGKTVKRILFNE
jgi:hypothetical protein